MIECMNFKPHKAGSLLGFANLFIEEIGLELYGCTMHEKDDSKWINLPSREYIDQNGDKKYINIVRFRERSHYNEFVHQGTECIQKWIQDNPLDDSNSTMGSKIEELPF